MYVCMFCIKTWKISFLRYDTNSHEGKICNQVCLANLSIKSHWGRQMYRVVRRFGSSQLDSWTIQNSFWHEQWVKPSTPLGSWATAAYFSNGNIWNMTFGSQMVIVMMVKKQSNFCKYLKLLSSYFFFFYCAIWCFITINLLIWVIYAQFKINSLIPPSFLCSILNGLHILLKTCEFNQFNGTSNAPKTSSSWVQWSKWYFNS